MNLPNQDEVAWTTAVIGLSVIAAILLFWITAKSASFIVNLLRGAND